MLTMKFTTSLKQEMRIYPMVITNGTKDLWRTGLKSSISRIVNLKLHKNIKEVDLLVLV